MIKKRMKRDKHYLQAAKLHELFANEIDTVKVPSDLEPQQIDNIIKRGNNLLVEHKVRQKKIRKQTRPMRVRILAAAMSLLLVVGVSVIGFQQKPQDITIYTVKTMKDAAESKSVGMPTVAESEGVAPDDYTPIITYLTELRKQAEKNNRQDVWETLEDAVEGAMDFGVKTEAVVEEEAPETATNSTMTKGEYSDTNNQVQNVQEGDIIKTDGRFVYVLSASSVLNCMQVAEDGSLTKTDSVDLIERFQDHPYLQEMFLYEDHIAVIGQHYGIKNSQITVLLFDVVKGRLVEAGSYAQEGDFVSARVTDGTLYIVTSQKTLSIYREYEDPQTFIPTVWNDGEARLVTTDEMYISGCDDTVMRYTTVSGYRFGDDPSALQVTSVLGSSAAQVYCTEDTLYVFAGSNRYMDGAANQMIYEFYTTVNSFVLENGKAIAYAQGSVKGRMLNQFSADEHDGMLRIATTDTKACRITVLDRSLQTVSELTGLAEGEDIYACKFMGDTAYLVTFYQTDPLFVLDLSDVLNIKIKGELKIPGYSEYLYPVGENYLIGVGRNADENGFVDGMRVNLFDVSDPCVPKLADVKIQYGDSASLAGETHKAYYSDAKNGIVGLPIYRYENGVEQFNGFVAFQVENGKLNVVKELDFLDKSSGLDWNSEKTTQYNYNYYNIYRVQRGIYIDETVYLLSDHCIYAYSRSDFAYLGQFDLD